MITKLRIKNFQVHKNLEIDLDPHITTIVGSSDRGKSAVVRALYWLCLNKPSGKNFIRHGASFTKVTALVDGKSLKRTRGKRNTYEVDQKTFQAIGASSIPPDVEKLLQVSETNFQRQLDQPYWFTESPGQVSKSLNKIVNLGKIDATLQHINNSGRKAKTKIEVIKERISEASEGRKRIKWVHGFDRELKRLEQIQAHLDSNRNKSHLLTGTIESIAAIKKRNRLARNAILCVAELQKIKRKYDSQRNRVNSLQKITESLWFFMLKIHNLPTQENIKALQEFRDKADSHADKVRTLFHLLKDLKEARRTSCRSKKELKEAQTRFKKITKKRCPTCGQSLLQSSVVTSTSAKKHPSLVQQRRIGLKRSHVH